jgi:hypothetical protein
VASPNLVFAVDGYISGKGTEVSQHAGSAELVFKRRRTDGSICFSGYQRYLQTRHRSVMTAGTRRRLVMQLRWYTAHLQARIYPDPGRKIRALGDLGEGANAVAAAGRVMATPSSRARVRGVGGGVRGDVGLAGRRNDGVVGRLGGRAVSGRSWDHQVLHRT